MKQWLLSPQKKWYTLIEIVIVIIIICIIAVWVGSFNFREQNTKQKLENDILQIINISEEVRNNALTWKWAWNPPQSPELWKIVFSQNPKSTIQSYYSLDKVSYTEYLRWKAPSWMSFLSLSCLGRSDVPQVKMAEIEIIFRWAKGDILSCDDESMNAIDFPSRAIVRYGNAQFSEEVHFDMLSGVIE